MSSGTSLRRASLRRASLRASELRPRDTAATPGNKNGPDTRDSMRIGAICRKRSAADDSTTPCQQKTHPLLHRCTILLIAPISDRACPNCDSTEFRNGFAPAYHPGASQRIIGAHAVEPRRKRPRRVSSFTGIWWSCQRRSIEGRTFALAVAALRRSSRPASARGTTSLETASLGIASLGIASLGIASLGIASLETASLAAHHAFIPTARRGRFLAA
jgi:hypothetical protein